MTTNQKSDAFKNLIEKYKPQIAVALPRHIDAERFTRMAINAAVNMPELLDCTPISQIGALMQAATLGLEPAVAGECWILPFKDNKTNTMVATFIPGYKGLIQLAWRSDQIANIGANAVYENDHFECQEFPPKLVHRRATGERGKPTGAYMYAMMKGGTTYQWTYMDLDEIMDIKKSSRGASSKYSPWNIAEYEHWMFRKTVLRQGLRFLPTSVELRQALDLDERSDSGLPQNFDFNLDPEKEVKQPKGEGAGETLKAPTEEVKTSAKPAQSAKTGNGGGNAYD